jgi:hypothetical protein
MGPGPVITFYSLVDLSFSQLDTSPRSMHLQPSFSVLLSVLITISAGDVEALQVSSSKRDTVTLPLKPVQTFQADIDAREVSKRNTNFTTQPSSRPRPVKCLQRHIDRG